MDPPGGQRRGEVELVGVRAGLSWGCVRGGVVDVGCVYRHSLTATAATAATAATVHRPPVMPYHFF